MTGTDPRDLQPATTDVRFGTRSLLLSMVAIAAACTALGAFLRQFPAEAQPRLVIYWGILFVLLLSVFAWNARARYKAEKKSGEVFFQLAPHSYFLPNTPRHAAVMAGTGLLLLGPAASVFGSYFVSDANNANWGPAAGWQSIYGVFCSGLGITYLWWHRNVRLSEHGIVIRHNFLPWNDVKRWYWDACTPDVIVLEFAQFNRVAAKVPTNMREALVKFLTERCEIKEYV